MLQNNILLKITPYILKQKNQDHIGITGSFIVYDLTVRESINIWHAHNTSEAELESG